MLQQQVQKLLTLKEASKWASTFLQRAVSESNISYLVQYGKVRKRNHKNTVCVDVGDLRLYYESYRGQREIDWKKKLGSDLNWSLSFDHLRESDTTKHVHRLHPYKGKFIPQLVEYFLDCRTDDFKKGHYFKSGDIILDPFSGSGTTLVQANEMGIHSIGIDISQFNCMIAESKLSIYDFDLLQKEVRKIRDALASYESDARINDFEKDFGVIPSPSNKSK